MALPDPNNFPRALGSTNPDPNLVFKALTPTNPSPSNLPSGTPALTPGGDAFRPPTTTPTFDDLRSRLAEPTQIAPLPTLGPPGVGGQATFEQGLEALAPGRGITPGIQSILDILSEQTREASGTAVSEAQALASRRGLAGSSIEQFGVAEGARGAEAAGQTAKANVLLQNLQSQQFEAQAFFDRANRIDQITSNQEITRLQAEANRGNTQAKLDLDRRLTEAGITSDDINTQKSIDLQLQQLEVERILGERGLALTAENINQAREIARRTSRDQIIGNVTAAFGPSIVSGIFKNIFPAKTAVPGATQTPGAQPGVQQTGGANLVQGAAKVLPAVVASQVVDKGLTEKLGEGGKAIVAPLFNPKQTVNKIAKTVKKIFPF